EEGAGAVVPRDGGAIGVATGARAAARSRRRHRTAARRSTTRLTTTYGTISPGHPAWGFLTSAEPEQGTAENTHERPSPREQSQGGNEHHDERNDDQEHMDRPATLR